MRLIVVDQYKGQTGYARAVRELTRAISAYVPVIYWDGKTDMTFDDNDYLLGRLPFQNLRPFYGKVKVIANLVLESTSLPEGIVCDVNKHIFKVWCPSTFCKTNYVNSGIIPEKIEVVPHGVDISIFKPLNKPHKDFTFLFVGGYTGKGDRKGADLLCRAFAEEFKNVKDVKLYLKINTVYGDATHELVEITKDVSDRVTINTVNSTDKEMNEIYNIGDCFVSPSYGEGFNMTILEAMACGLPIITSNWGGQMDFVPLKNIIIEANDKVVPRYTPWDVGLWKGIYKDALKYYMREAIGDRKRLILLGNLNSKVANEWVWNESAKKAVTGLLNISTRNQTS